jgi:uncharacterized membrane protein
MSPDAGHRAPAVALAVARALAAIIGLALLYWAGHILSNIWGENDSGVLLYLLFASVPGIPGLALMAFALRALRR